MAIQNGYITLAQLKNHLSIGTDPTVDDTKLENVITSVSRWIDRHCERHFWQDGTALDPVARVFDSCDGETVVLGPFNDLVGVAPTVAVDVDADGTFSDVWDPADFQLLPLRTTAPEPEPYRFVRALGRTFPRPKTGERVGRVRITDVWGWPAFPAPAPEACLIQSARIFKRKDAPEGVVGFGEFGSIRVSGRLDPDVAANLTAYVHPEAAKVA